MVLINVNLVALFIGLLVTMVTYEIGMDLSDRLVITR